MWGSFRNILRGLWLLRHGDVVRSLGEEKLHRMQLEALRSVALGARISDSVLVFGYRPGVFSAGKGAQIREGSVLAFGDEIGGHGQIRIGARSWIGQYNNLRAGGGDIKIGEDCLISQFCSIVATNHAHARGASIQSQGSESSPTGVVLADDVWLGAGSAVMPGVSIGLGAIVAANAVVTHNIPDYEIWGGVPARKIGERS